MSTEELSSCQELPLELQNELMNQYNAIKNLDDRFYNPKDHSSSQRTRGNYQRDYARILYSSSFRRLQGKMQLLGIQSDQFIRNRLTHSLEVSQIANGILDHIKDHLLSPENSKEFYCNNDIYVLYSAALAHDIGNPPFGHSGEKILNNIMKDKITKELEEKKLCAKCKIIENQFEGNAQSFRVINSLEKKFPEHRGLNLTYRTLLSIVKYNICQSELKSKFLYQEDFKFLNEYINKKKLDNKNGDHTNLKIKIRTLDAQILDLADEIAYAAHDLEDCLSLNLFTLEDLLYEFSLLKNNYKQQSIMYDNSKDKLYELIKDASKYAFSAKNYATSEEYSFIKNKEIISKLVNTLINDITFSKVDDSLKNKTHTENEFELSFKYYGILSEAIKELTFKCVCRRKNTKLYEKQGKVIIETLFNYYIKNPEMLPPEYTLNIDKHEIYKHEISRNVADYISGMMDSYAFKKYYEITGKNSISII